MATAAVTLPGGAGASGVIPCPLPATVEDAIRAAQKMQPGGWENAVLSQGVQHLKPGTTLEAAAYTLVSYDTLGSRAINVPQTECRGINLKQLSQLVDFIRDHAHLWMETYSGSPNFEQPLELQTFNLYHTSHWVIKPATLRYRCSFVELVAKDAETQFPCWFVSHAWQEAVCRFVACLRQHAELRNAVGLAYWVCAYANNQHKLQEEISANPRGTSFYKAMKLAVGVVLILDRDVEERNTGTPLLLDVAATDASNQAHVITDGLAAPEARLMPLLGFLTKALREANFPTLLAQKGLSVDISKADASKAEDKIRILNCIRLPQARTKARNKALAAHFAIASWFGAVTQGHDTSNLRRALAADSSRHMVELSFTGCRGFGDDSLQQLLNHLPRKLRLLRLDLAFSGVQSWNFQKEMPPLEQLTLRFTGSRLADASGLAQMLDTEQCLAGSLKSLQLWFSNLPSLVELGSWEPLTKLHLEELVLQLKRCGQVPPEAKQSLYACVQQLKRARELLNLPGHGLGLEVELAGSKAVDYVDFDDAIDDCGGRAWRWAELSLLFTMQAAAEIQQRTTLAVILLSLYPVACLSLEESLGVPWAVICTLLSVIVLSSIVTTSIRFDTVRTQILQEAVATEASYSQVLQLPEAQNVIGVPWLPSHAGNMLRVPTMDCGYADPRDLRQQSEDLRAMNVALPDARLKLKLLTSLSDEEKRSPQQVLDALRFELMCENMQSVQEAFKGLKDRLASEEMVALGVRIAAVRDTFAEMSGAASGQKCCQVVLQVEDYYSSVFLMDVTLTRLENQLSDLTKLADNFGLLDDVKSKWETSLRLCNDASSVGPLTMAGTIFLQIVALVVSFFMAVQYFLRYAPRIRSRLSDFLLDALLLDTEESNETFLEAAFLALPYLVLVLVFLLQLLCRNTSRKRPRPTEVLYEKYFGLRGAYYPFKVAIFQCFTVAVQALGKISLLGGLVTFAQEEQDVNAILWLSVGFWAFFALLCWNSLYPAFLLMFPDAAWARIGAAFMDAALDLGYILTYLGMVLVAMLRLQTASEGWGNFGEDLTLQFSNRISPVFAFPTDFLGYGAVYFNLAHACCIAHILQHTNWSLPVRPRGERQKRRYLPTLFGCSLSIGLLSVLVILLVTQDVFPMNHGQDFTCFPCRCSDNADSAGQQIDSCTLAAVLRQKQVHLAAKNITAVDPKAFSSLGHVQRLSLANNSLIHLPPGLFEGLSSLEQLDLTRVELATLHEDSFRGLEQLKLLAMSDNQLTELSAAMLQHLPLLEQLLLGGKRDRQNRVIVKGNRIQELGTIFGHNEQLQVIDFSGNKLQKIDPATFAGPKKLRWLSLKSNQLTTLSAGAFQGLGQLQKLDLTYNRLTTLPAGTFQDLGQLQREIWIPGALGCGQDCAGTVDKISYQRDCQ
ncbi:unnamed protein product [Cladocopium goreaui]|uniref:G-protein coupled receptor 125 n=1 Tax=Cladocopium goreaui TaxID=2562237 RepID=A0A9P1GPE5_9DINO|nr:unnamed protein product [Cladocopium goreaui]